MSDKKKLWEEMEGSAKPPKKDYYHTDHGKLWYDGTGFQMPGHRRTTYTTVEWWLKPYVPES